MFGYEEHTPEHSADFLGRLLKVCPFSIQTVQTDNGTEFTYKFINLTEKGPFEKALTAKGISHKLIPPRTPWHNGKVEHSHHNNQRYFYDWQKFASVYELNQKLETHLSWNNKAMRTLVWKNPLERLASFLGSHH